jgi:3-isopropylmalate/(R)-2-methylmalate dehydratase large subunit
VVLEGNLQPGVTSKDMILHLLATYGAGGGAGHVIEFDGSAVRDLDMEARMTLCNMATEFAAFSAIIAPDHKALAWIEGRRYAPRPLPDWSDLMSDSGAAFDQEIVINAAEIAPMVSWGTSPSHTIPIDGTIPANAPERALEYMGVEVGQRVDGLPINVAFIGSCTNSRLSDLRRAAAVVKGSARLTACSHWLFLALRR